MTSGVSVATLSGVCPPYTETDFHWVGGQIRLGKRLGPPVAGSNLTMYLGMKGSVARVAVLRTVLEPVHFVDVRYSGALSLVHMFRYEDQHGGTWLVRFCAGCGMWGQVLDQGVPLLEYCCPRCGAERRAVVCEGWHAWGECPYCPAVESESLAG